MKVLKLGHVPKAVEQNRLITRHEAKLAIGGIDQCSRCETRTTDSTTDMQLNRSFALRSKVRSLTG